MPHDCDPCSRPCEIANEPDSCDLLWPWLEILKDCVCLSLESSLGGPVCRCLFVAGQQAAWDNCCQGQAWIRVVSVFPSQNFPSPDGGRFRCDHSAMAAQLEIGVIRCAPTFDEQGNPPSVEAMEESFRVVHSDRARVMRAVKCCFQAESQCEEVNVGTWTPLGESGGCVGGVTNVTVSFSDCGCCCDDDLGFVWNDQTQRCEYG